MVLMFSGLLSLALLEVAVPVGFATEWALPWASRHHVRRATTLPPAKIVLVRPTAEDANGERDCIDDSDTSDESSSPKQRTQGFGGSLSRHALARFRAQREQIIEAPRETL